MFDFGIRSASGEKGDDLKMKKIWQKPKLIILSRGRPEEFVLAGCKMAGTSVATKNKNKGRYTAQVCGTACKEISTSLAVF